MSKKLHRLIAPNIRSIVFIFVIFLLLLFVAKLIVVTQRISKESGLDVGTIARLIFDSGATLYQTDNRTNILVLGVGGGTHEGADLTDTILIVSMNLTTKKLSLLSLPRDIWSDTLKDKINSAYHYGERKKKDGGLVLSKAIIEDISGIPIHYSILVDFSGFTNIIDLVGGVDITVPLAFTDPTYPIAGKEKDLCDGDQTYRCRYEPLHFDSGLQHMNGVQALKYVRSRHAEGDEGTDFARGRRQQELIVALKQRMSDRSWISLSNVRQLIQSADDATKTDMNMGEILTFAKLIRSVTPDEIGKIATDSLLVNPPQAQYGGLYVLVPKESWDEIHTFIKNSLR